ncbi:PD-(D/E)XK nuclease family protein [Edaphobacter sp. HDX4]
MIRPSTRERLLPNGRDFFQMHPAYNLRYMHATARPEKLPQTIANALERGLMVVTANQRAARTFRYAFHERNRLAGFTNWVSPAILPWESWITGLWRTLLLKGEVSDVLLNHSQEHALWVSIIAADSELPPSLRSRDTLADMASEAWRRLARHNGLKRLRDAWITSDTKSFQRWAEEFERRCRMQKFLPRAALEGRLRHFVTEGRLPVAPIALVGFDEIAPSQQAFLDAITTAGVSVEQIENGIFANHRLLTSAENEIQELIAAARWARKMLEEDPARRIAVIVPSLEAKRSQIDRIFRETISPEMEDIQAAAHQAPYEFSLGVPLSDTPMVRVALDLVRWCKSPLPVAKVSALLVSPLFAMEESERNRRAAFDAFELRKARMLRPEISLPSLLDALRRSRRKPHLDRLIDVLSAMARASVNIPDEQRPHAIWSESIRNWLQIARWGRGSSEDSIDFQVRRKWESTLDELATLDFDGTLVPFAKAVEKLERLTQQTMFAPESHQAPVQVMGPLEAAGSTFDAIWFVGAGDFGWPAKSAASPLLPWSLQRDLGMPGADDALEEERGRKLTARIAASAAEVIFSYPVDIPEGIQRPSPSLRQLHLEATSLASVAPAPPDTAPLALEEFSDTLPIPLLPDRVVRGGAEILKLQAACAFRAFAERRLGSTQLREIELGLDAGERGSVLHRILEDFWKRIGSQAVLKGMSAQERSAALAASIEYGLQKTAAAATTEWERAYVDLQRARFLALLNTWIDLELRRDPFIVKSSEEDARDAIIGPLRLDLRVDRVDLTDQGEIIIDYKSGGAKASHWESDRPDEPQLPLYAVISKAAHPETPLADLAFAQIRAGRDIAFESFTGKITPHKSSKKNNAAALEEQLDQWRATLEELAGAFHRGASEVDPKRYPETCAHCGQRILCRLNPAAFGEDLDEEATIDLGNG